MKLGHIVPTLCEENSKENILNLIKYAKNHAHYNLYLCYTKEKIKSSNINFLEDLIYKNNNINNINFIPGRKGIYKSMNDALKLSDDDWLYFSGDSDKIYIDNILKALNSLYKIGSEIWPIMILGDTKVGRRLFKGNYKNLRESTYWYNSNKLHHQSIIYNKKIILSITNSDYFYDESYRFLSDYDLNCKIYKYTSINHKFLATNDLFCDFDLYGLTSLGKIRGYIEMAKIKNKVNRTSIFLSYLISIVAYLRKLFILSFNTFKKK